MASNPACRAQSATKREKTYSGRTQPAPVRGAAQRDDLAKHWIKVSASVSASSFRSSSRTFNSKARAGTTPVHFTKVKYFHKNRSHFSGCSGSERPARSHQEKKKTDTTKDHRKGGRFRGGSHGNGAGNGTHVDIYVTYKINKI
jgi:hypothetical protein